MSQEDDLSPLDRFLAWLKKAEASEPRDPNAMALATATTDGQPSLRMVLLKGVDERGFVFYSNSDSQKGQELEVNARAALLFHWKSLNRQIRISGTVVPVTPVEADAYFTSRNRASRIGAWASKQSRVMDGMTELTTRVTRYAARFGVGDIPRPEFWIGYRVIPNRFEFWQEGAFRLHMRWSYRPTYPSGGSYNPSKRDDWQVDSLFP